MNRNTTSLHWVLLFVAGCGGSCPRTEDAASTDTTAVSAPSGSDESTASAAEEAPAEDAPSSASAPDEPERASKHGDPTAEPTFPEGASVAQAVAAVPQGAQRANIEPDVLGAPLQSSVVYEPCNVGAQHFKLKVAVWNGRAVGVDVETPNKKLGACVEKQIRGLSWPDKVRSLNTVEYSM